MRWWNRLSVKLPAIIAAMTLAAIGGFVLVAVQAQRGHLTGEVVRSAALFSDTIKSSTYHFMLEDRREEVYRIMETIGRQEGVERVRIFNKDGKITFSTHRGEIGALVDKRAESCYACHATDQPIVRLAVPSRSRIYHAADSHRVLAMVTPIYNERSCFTASCHAHPEGQQVLGVVDVGLSLADIDRGVAGLERRTLLLSALAVLALAAFVALFERRLVLSPVSRLVEGTRRVAEGELEHKIPIKTADEIGVLATSFNQMTESLRKAQGEIQSLMGSLERQVEERTAALRQAQSQLIQSEKMASLGKLAASIAHEINNPLSGILTCAKLVSRTLDEGQADEAARLACLRQLRLVERETQRCTAIVRNLLDFARQREPTFNDIDVNACIEEALSLLRNQISIQGVAVEKRLGRLPVVRADFGQLRQAFVNVALNACEAMPKGGALAVASRVVQGAKMVEVELTDTGVGIPADHLPKILDPFFTTKEKGTGLGLSVVYGIVERHGGALDIRSQVGKGTTVLIRLPLSSVSEEAAA